MSTSPVLKVSDTLVKGLWFYEMAREVTALDVDTSLDVRKLYGTATMSRSVYATLKPAVLKELETLLVYIYGKCNTNNKVCNRGGEMTEPIKVKGVHKDNKDLRELRAQEAAARLEERGRLGGDQAIIDKCVKEYNDLFKRSVEDANRNCTSTIRNVLRNSWADLDHLADVARDLEELNAAEAEATELRNSIREKRAAAFLAELEKDKWSVTDGDVVAPLAAPLVAELKELLSVGGVAFRENTVRVRTEA